MKFSQILIGLTFLYSFAFAENNCEKIKNTLKREDARNASRGTPYNIKIDKCIEDDNGIIKTLVIKNNSNDYGHLPGSLFLRTSYTVENVTIEGVEIDNLIKDFTSLSNVKELNIVNCIDYNIIEYNKDKRGCKKDGEECLEYYKNDINWNYLLKFSSLNTLIINDGIDVPTWFIREYMEKVKTIEINGKTPSKLSDCKDIKNYLKRNGVKNKVECIENKQGQVISIKTAKLQSKYNSENKLLKRLNSYPTLESLEFSDELENEIEPSNEMTCSKAKQLGYECCSHCHSIYNDKDASWGADDNGEWCIIPDQCQNEYNECWSIEKGYPCCNHCNVATEDKSGKWGIMDKNWCGIPLNC